MKKNNSMRPEQTEELRHKLLHTGEYHAVPSAMRSLMAQHPAEIAHLLESLPANQRQQLWQLIPPRLEASVLLELGEEVRRPIIETMKVDEILAATRHMEIDDLTDFIQSLPDALLYTVLRSMDHQRRAKLEDLLSYPEKSAGGLMDTDVVTVRSNVRIEAVQRYLRMRGALPPHTDRLIVVDRDDHYVGMLPLERLLVSSPETRIDAIMETDAPALLADTSSHQVARLFADHDLLSAAIIDSDKRLLGRITVDDVVDVIREQGEENMMHMAGLSSENDLFAPVLSSIRRRALWLGINLLTALLATWVISWFESTLQQMVLLAVLMPIVASMGGIAGSQTLTLVIRGQALQQLGPSNLRIFFQQEMVVAFCNGLLWAVVIGLLTWFWFKNGHISMIIGGAILANLLIAGLSGVAAPIILRKLGIDPALSGSVILTTVTDVAGFLIFLGMASLFLLG